MTGRRGSKRVNSSSSRPHMGPEQSHVEVRQEQPGLEMRHEQSCPETRTEQPRHETRAKKPRPNENVGNLTLEQLGQFITRTVDEAIKRNQESMFAKEQATCQEQGENDEGQKSRIEATQPLPSGLPPYFRQSNVGEYDGRTDPEDYLGRFENATLLHQYSDGIKCKEFLGTLVSSAQQWFNTLQPNSLRSFEDFLLISCTDSLEARALDIPDASPDTMISAFTQGLGGGEFFKSLVKKPPSSYDDLLSWAEKYVNLEDAQRHKRMEQRPGGIRVEGAERGGRKRGAGEREEDKVRGIGQLSSHVPLYRIRDKMMEVRDPEGSGRSRKGLRAVLDWLRRTNEKDPHPGVDRDLPQDHVINFGPEDLRDIVTPHNDALVVTAIIANYDVAKIFIDSGSSVNVLFKSTLDKMKVEGVKFEPVSTLLYGFAGHAIPPLGQIVLLLSLGTDHRRVKKMIAFTVVDNPSAYNGILGRPALKDFRAVASTYHQKLKFTVGEEVGVLYGDQNVARQCYEGVVMEEGKRARVEVNMIRK
ncbi:uncharacterized protein [Primulina eburnea]|uniref:uncharacterized protein n=1 Tax=Primulina eburnea TaxID=1245227 RepID=UPI003C6C9903